MANKPNKQGTDSNIATRRRVLKGAAAGGTLLLAGCSSNSNESTEANDGGETEGERTTSGSEDSQRIKRTAKTVAQSISPTELQFNDLNPKNFAGDIVGQMNYERFIWYVPGNDEYVPRVFKDWSFDGKMLTATVDTNYTWHNGDSLTVDDVTTHWKLQIHRDRLALDGHPYFKSVKKVDDQTVEFTMHKKFNPDLVLQSNFVRWNSGRMMRKNSVYKKWLKQFENASSKSDRQSVLQELQSTRIEEPLGTGPFQFDTANEQYFQNKVFTDYPMADKINFTKDRINAYQSQQQMVSAISNAEVDLAEAFSPQPDAVMEQWPDDRTRLEAPSYGGRSILFNNDRISDPRVRQAIAYVINSKDVGTNLPPNQEGINRVTSIYEEAQDRWLQDTVGQFPNYKPNKEKAVQLLKDAGYSKQGGTWKDSDGNNLSLDFISPPWSDTWTPVAKTTGDQLNNFGIDAQVTVTEGSTWSNATESGDYDMTVWWWGDRAHPFFHLEDVFNGGTAETAKMADKAEWQATPFGKPNADEKTYNVRDLLSQVRTARDTATSREAIQQLAWIYSTKLPLYPITEGYMTHWVIRPDRFQVTSDNEGYRSVNDPLNDLPRIGGLKAVQK